MIKIGSSKIGGGRTFVIAEIGINHNGSVTLAKRLIDAAVLAGCDAVKFQKRTIPVVYPPEDLAKKRQIPPDNGIMAMAIKRGVLASEAVQRLQASGLEDTTNGDLKWALEFTSDEYATIVAYAQERDIICFASPWDEESVDFLEEIGVPCHKIASASLTDEGLLRRVKATGKPVILSTGMSTLAEIDRSVGILGTDQLVVMHCISTYPTRDEDLNLSMIPVLRERYGVPVGYSGHEKSILPSAFSVIYGACMVERHITLDRRLWGSDQAASIEPDEFASLVKAVRLAEITRGTGEKTVSRDELEIQKKLRRRYYE